MPNHVTSICTALGPVDQITSFRAATFADPDNLFDFNAVVPMPAILREAEASTSAEFGAQLIVARAGDERSYFEDNVAIPANWLAHMRKETGAHHIGEVARIYLAAHPDFEVAGKKRLVAILETGFASWYPWSIAHWGTKWGAYSVEVCEESADAFTFKFETAWSFPEPIFAALVEKFPDLTFDCLCFDEGWNFAGEGQFGALVVQPFRTVEASDALYERVYGHKPEKDEDEEAAA